MGKPCPQGRAPAVGREKLRTYTEDTGELLLMEGQKWKVTVKGFGKWRAVGAQSGKKKDRASMKIVMQIKILGVYVRSR